MMEVSRKQGVLREIGKYTMGQDHLPVQKANNDTEMVKRLLHRLEELWQYPHELPFETMKNLLIELPEEDRVVAVEALAEHLVHLMKLHFLDIMAKFHQMAREEEMDAEERDEIASDARQELLPMLERLGKQLSIHSVKELVLLANITIGLSNLSHVESAEQAERWLYRLPRMYRDRLVGEHLVKEPAQVTATVCL